MQRVDKLGVPFSAAASEEGGVGEDTDIHPLVFGRWGVLATAYDISVGFDGVPVVRGRQGRRRHRAETQQPLPVRRIGRHT